MKTNKITKVLLLLLVVIINITGFIYCKNEMFERLYASNLVYYAGDKICVNAIYYFENKEDIEPFIEKLGIRDGDIIIESTIEDTEFEFDPMYIRESTTDESYNGLYPWQYELGILLNFVSPYKDKNKLKKRKLKKSPDFIDSGYYIQIEAIYRNYSQADIDDSEILKSANIEKGKYIQLYFKRLAYVDFFEPFETYSTYKEFEYCFYKGFYSTYESKTGYKLIKIQ